jgi:hypothetical protein
MATAMLAAHCCNAMDPLQESGDYGTTHSSNGDLLLPKPLDRIDNTPPPSCRSSLRSPTDLLPRRAFHLYVFPEKSNYFTVPFVARIAVEL